MSHLTYWCAALLLLCLAAGRSVGDPPSVEELRQLNKMAAGLKATLAAETTAVGKVGVLAKAYHAEPKPDVRRVVLETLPSQPDAAYDAFLIGVLTGDADAGIRSLAAKSLGAHGTAQCLPALVKAASSDKTTDLKLGCLCRTGTARRAATFAVAELAARYPTSKDKAAAELKAITPSAEPKDSESLADARVQALYQVTRDEKLLAPFLEQLRSNDATVREHGVVALQFFKLKAAPPELVAALNDSNKSVQSWAVLALAGIGDPKTVPALMAVAGSDGKEFGVRCNAIHALGRMNAAPATELMRKLLADENPAVQSQAAIALYHITGEKVKQYPAGYNAD